MTNLLTPEEAQKRWCPFARVAEAGRYSTDANVVAAVNRGSDAMMSPDHQPNALCIGPACAAWREIRVHHQQGGKVLRGYCGLAGEPKE